MVVVTQLSLGFSLASKVVLPQISLGISLASKVVVRG
jgi:hypothetical protein